MFLDIRVNVWIELYDTVSDNSSGDKSSNVWLTICEKKTFENMSPAKLFLLILVSLNCISLTITSKPNLQPDIVLILADDMGQ